MFSGMNGMDMDEDASPFASFGGGGARPRAGQRQQQDDGEPLPDIVKPLACSLEELYTGTVRQLRSVPMICADCLVADQEDED